MQPEMGCGQLALAEAPGHLRSWVDVHWAAMRMSHLGYRARSAPSRNRTQLGAMLTTSSQN